MFEHLVDAHHCIRQAIEEFNLFLDNDGSEAADDLMRRRTEFTSFFKDHISLDHELVQRMAASGDPRIQPIAKAYSERFGKLYLDYNSHTRFWQPERVRNDPGGFKIAARALQQRLFDLMEWEEKEMVPALQRFASE